MTYNEHLDPELERVAQELERDARYRVLREVPPRFSRMPDDGVRPEGRCLALIDLETSGLDPENDRIIELAVMLVWISDDAQVSNHVGPFVWNEDPGVPLSPEITMITGLTNEQLSGEKIDDRKVLRLLSRADLLVAHNCRFEIAWLERRYPSLVGAPWGCSMADIDWLKAGLDGRAQQHLLMQHGWFSRAHRAADDVWSLFILLQERRQGWEQQERTHLQRLVENAGRTGALVEAVRAPYAKKELLRERGYRWNPSRRVWTKEIEPALLDDEQAWFFRVNLPTPAVTKMTACERHR